MDESKRKALLCYRPALIKCLILEHFIADLHEEAGGVLNDVEEQTILAKEGNRARMFEFFTILLTKGNGAFDNFCSVLDEDRNHREWAKKLRDKASERARNAFMENPVIPRFLNEFRRLKVTFIRVCSSREEPLPPTLEDLKDYCYDIIEMGRNSPDRASRVEDDIHKCRSIKELANILFHNLCTWITFDFLELLLDYFRASLKDMRREVDRYKEGMKPVIEDKLEALRNLKSEYPDECSSREGFTEIIAQHHIDTDGISIDDLLAARGFLCRRLRIRKELLQVLTTFPGSTNIVLLTISELVPGLMIALESNKDELHRFGFLSITVGSNPPIPLLAAAVEKPQHKPVGKPPPPHGTKGTPSDSGGTTGYETDSSMPSTEEITAAARQIHDTTANVGPPHSQPRDSATGVGRKHSQLRDSATGVGHKHSQPRDSVTSVRPPHSQPHALDTGVGPPHSQPHDSATSGGPPHSQPRDSATGVGRKHSQPRDSATSVRPPHNQSRDSATGVVRKHSQYRNLATGVGHEHSQPRDSATSVRPPHSQPRDSATSVGPPHRQSSNSATGVGRKHSQPRDSATSIRPPDSQPHDSATSVGPTHSQSRNSATSVGRKHSQPRDSATSVRPPHSQPRDSATSVGPPHKQSSNSATGVGRKHSQPRDSATSVGPPHSQSRNSATGVGRKHSQPHDSATSVGPPHSQPHDSATSVGPPHSQSRDSATSVGPSHSQPHDSATGVGRKHSQPRDSATSVGPPHNQPHDSATGVGRKHSQPCDSATGVGAPHSQRHDSATIAGSPHSQRHDSATIAGSPHSQPRDSATIVGRPHSQPHDTAMITGSPHDQPHNTITTVGSSHQPLTTTMSVGPIHQTPGTTGNAAPSHRPPSTAASVGPRMYQHFGAVTLQEVAPTPPLGVTAAQEPRQYQPFHAPIAVSLYKPSEIPTSSDPPSHQAVSTDGAVEMVQHQPLGRGTGTFQRAASHLPSRKAVFSDPDTSDVLSDAETITSTDLKLSTDDDLSSDRSSVPGGVLAQMLQPQNVDSVPGIHTFVDTQSLSEHAKVITANHFTCMGDSRVQIDIGRLNHVMSRKSPIYEGNLLCSCPSFKDSLWNEAEKERLKVQVQNPSAKVQKEASQPNIRNLILKLVYTSEQPGCLVMASCDKKYEPILLVAMERKWKVELWTWSRAFNSTFLSRKDANGSLLTVHLLDDITKHVVLVEDDFQPELYRYKEISNILEKHGLIIRVDKAAVVQGTGLSLRFRQELEKEARFPAFYYPISKDGVKGQTSDFLAIFMSSKGDASFNLSAFVQKKPSIKHLRYFATWKDNPQRFANILGELHKKCKDKPVAPVKPVQTAPRPPPPRPAAQTTQYYSPLPYYTPYYVYPISRNKSYLCRYYLNSSCSRGSRCDFAHGPADAWCPKCNVRGHLLDTPQCKFQSTGRQFYTRSQPMTAVKAPVATGQVRSSQPVGTGRPAAAKEPKVIQNFIDISGADGRKLVFSQDNKTQDFIFRVEKIIKIRKGPGKDVLASTPSFEQLQAVSKMLSDHPQIWQQVCVHLNVPYDRIKECETEIQGDPAQASTVAMEIWRKGETDKPKTWAILLEALEKAGLLEMALDIEERLKDTEKLT